MGQVSGRFRRLTFRPPAEVLVPEGEWTLAEPELGSEILTRRGDSPAETFMVKLLPAAFAR